MNSAPFATWDDANQRFRSPLCCPEPSCGETIHALPSPPATPTADRCVRCGRPFERTSIRTQAGGAPMEITRRLGASFCTMTGNELMLPSPLDWAEAGGGPGRTGALPDPRAAFFGAANPNRVVELSRAWHVNEIFGPDEDAADPVRSVLVVRGRLVVTSAGGRTAVLLSENGESVLPPGECLEWPDGSAVAGNDECSVSQSAAVRGGRLCIVASHQVVIRDIREYLGRPSRPLRAVASIEANNGGRFFGPPLGIDSDRPLFVVLEGGADSADGILGNPIIRAVDAAGVELGAWEAPGIVRPPVFDGLNQVLVWITETGTMCSLPLAALEGRGGAVVSSHPDGEFHATFDSRATLVISPNPKGWAEVWLAEPSLDGNAFSVWHALLHPRAHPTKYPATVRWTWDHRVCLASSGAIRGLAIGLGGRNTADAASDLACITSDDGVFALRKSSPGVLEHGFAPGPATGSLGGSADPPMLCSAGIITRTNLGVYLHSDPAGWGRDHGQRFISMPSTDRRPQGLAMLGRRVFAGLGAGVVAVDLQPKESR